MIVKGDIKTHFKITLMAVSGLPGSGKSTLVDRLVPNQGRVRAIEYHGEGHSHDENPQLGLHEVGYCSTTRRGSITRKWGEYTRGDIYMFMLARALLERNRARPILKEWTYVNSLPNENRHLQNHFKKLYNKMRTGLLGFAESESDFFFHLMNEPSYVLFNMWDIGFNKALNEALPLIARLMQPFLLLNVLDLSRDGLKELRNLPEKTRQQENQYVMRGRSRGHYFCRICRLCKKKGRSIMIATHRDKIAEEDVERVSKLTEAGIRAKASDVGAQELQNMLTVNLHDDANCEDIKRCIEETMESTRAFDIDLHLTWIFLHSALLDYTCDKSDFLMERCEFNALAQECGLKSTEDTENCLEFFTTIGSLMYSAKYLGDKIIYNPRNFFRKLNTLYDSVERGHTHSKESTGVGILCKKVAREIWGGDTEFFWKLMQKAGVAVPTKVSVQQDPYDHYDYMIPCPLSTCTETELLFVPSLRKVRLSRGEGMDIDSLYITFNSEYIPADIQVHLVKHLKPKLPELKLKLTKQYNSTEFKFTESGGDLKIIVHGDVVELMVKGLEDKPEREKEVKQVIRATCVTVLDRVLQHFPEFEYQLGLLCTHCRYIAEDEPPNNNVTSYLHFLPYQRETELYCRDYFHKRVVDGKNGEEQVKKCGKMRKLSESQMRWMTSNGTVNHILF